MYVQLTSKDVKLTLVKVPYSHENLMFRENCYLVPPPKSSSAASFERFKSDFLYLNHTFAVTDPTIWQAFHEGRWHYFLERQDLSQASDHKVKKAKQVQARMEEVRKVNRKKRRLE